MPHSEYCAPVAHSMDFKLYILTTRSQVCLSRNNVVVAFVQARWSKTHLLVIWFSLKNTIFGCAKGLCKGSVQQGFARVVRGLCGGVAQSILLTAFSREN